MSGYPIADSLKVSNNRLDSYLPLRNKNNEFDWDLVTGLVLSHALKKQVKKYDFDQFKADCQARLTERLDEPAFWAVLEKMYFTNGDVFNISPLFLLFRAQFSGSGQNSLGPANWRLGTLYASLMGNYFFTDPLQDRLNFIELEMLEVLQSELKESEDSSFSQEIPYLPYLAKSFQQDLALLAMHPKYLLQEFSNMLRLYAFTYCAQLALNMGNWKRGEPSCKPLFFILDTEKASSERAQVQNYGYKLFSRESYRLFPLLSALEVLQKSDIKRPLWMVYQEALIYPEKSHLLRELNQYITAFISDRKLNEREPSNDLEEVFEQFIQVAEEQFRDVNSDRPTVNKNYVKQLESQICDGFIQIRGRAGRVLVLNQDQLLLLTNLAVGKQEKLRLHELLSQFELRGFYLDNQTRQALVSFYERMGNVERMSDSGDAVYVRKTI